MEHRFGDTSTAELEQQLTDYKDAFWNSDEGATARAYMSSRGFSDETLRKFEIGYAPRNPRDKFGTRTMFPIRSEAGRLLGFAGRTMSNSRVKYLNSSESDGFKKTEALFGLFQARETMFKKNKAVIVEGYTDVMAMHQVGYRNAVACMSLTLTNFHLSLIAHYTDNLIFAYDQDSRGQAGMEKNIKKAQEAGFNVTKLRLPEGKDPAEYFLEN